VVVSHTSSFNAKRNGGAGVEESGGVVGLGTHVGVVASHAWLVGATGGFEEVGNLDPGCNKEEGEDYKQVLDGWFE
jgi:hypothetical protein